MRPKKFTKQMTGMVAALTLATSGMFVAYAQEPDKVDSDKIQVDGTLAFQVKGIEHAGTTYMPIWHVMQIMQRIGFATSWDGHEWDIGTSTAQLQSISYRSPSNKAIVLNGKLLYSVPSLVYQGTTYMPIWYAMQVLGQLGDQSDWSNNVWTLSLPTNQHYTYPTAFGPASNRDMVLDGTRLYRVPGINHNNTVYLPIWYITQLLQKLNIGSAWTGTEWDFSSTAATPTSIGFVPRAPDERAIVLDGQMQSNVSSIVYGGTTYMPAWYVMNVLQKLNVQNAWDGWTWSVKSPQPQNGNGNSSPSTPPSTSGTPTPPPSGGASVVGFVTNYGGTNTSLQDFEQHAGVANVLNSFTHIITPTGDVQGQVDSAAVSFAKSHGIPVYVTVDNNYQGNFNGSMMHDIMTSPDKTSHLIQSIQNLGTSGGFTGINMDIEMLPTADRAAFSAFIAQLRTALTAAHLKLTIDVPALTSAAWGGYDYSSLAANTDQVIIMAYDFSYPGGPAGPIAPLPWVQKVLAYATSQMPANKIVLGIDAYGYDWVGTKTTAASLRTIDGLIAKGSVTPQWDATNHAPFYHYTDSAGAHTVYYENQQSLEDRLTAAKSYHLGGLAIWHMGIEDDAVWTAISNYLQSTN